MIESLPESRRERRIAARRSQILTAAAAVFSQKGYQNASTKEIADMADVSEGTLYNYFANKQELLIGVAQNYTDEVVNDIESVQGESFEDMLSQLMANRFRRGQERRLFMLFLHESRNNQDVHRYYVEEAMHRIISVTEARVRSLVAEGKMRDVNPEVAGKMMSATIMGFAALFELGITLDLTPEQLGGQLTDIFLHGLSRAAEATIEDV